MRWIFARKNRWRKKEIAQLSPDMEHGISRRNRHGNLAGRGHPMTPSGYDPLDLLIGALGIAAIVFVIGWFLACSLGVV